MEGPKTNREPQDPCPGLRERPEMLLGVWLPRGLLVGAGMDDLVSLYRITMALDRLEKYYLVLFQMCGSALNNLFCMFCLPFLEHR